MGMRQESAWKKRRKSKEKRKGMGMRQESAWKKRRKSKEKMKGMGMRQESAWKKRRKSKEKMKGRVVDEMKKKHVPYVMLIWVFSSF